jgi:hypothetical protein
LREEAGPSDCNNGDTPRIYGNTTVLDLTLAETDPNFMVEDLFWGRFPFEIGMVAEDVMGVPLVMTMQWTSGYVKYSVAYEGMITYKWNPTYVVKKIKDPAMAMIGIGTRSPSGAGPCTVYFDDVYVLRRY